MRLTGDLGRVEMVEMEKGGHIRKIYKKVKWRPGDRMDVGTVKKEVSRVIP